MLVSIFSALVTAAAFNFLISLRPSEALAAPPNQQTQQGQAIIGITVPIQIGKAAIGGGGYPAQGYFNHIATIYNGDYRDAYRL